MLSLNFIAAREHARDLRRAAGRRHRTPSPGWWATRVTLREGAAEDDHRLRNLAAIDSAPVPGGRVLLAEVDGRLRAAMPLDGSQPIADPFHHGAELIELLRLRAAQLRRR